jgi:hypothetical protein
MGPKSRNYLTVQQPSKAASVLYYQLFPLAKNLAKSIIETCLPEVRTGFNGGQALVEIFTEQNLQHIATYSVVVRMPWLENLSWDAFPHTSMNVYQADELGRVRRHRYGSPTSATTKGCEYT